MKRLELISLIITNFKGIKHFELHANKGNVEVLGSNGTGKTTLFDAFIFLTFGKDSKGNSEFEIKGLDENGKVKQHGLEHSVEGVFQLDGNTFSLKRVYKEKWTKKRGSSNKVFSGHTTEFYIDDLPKSKKLYEEKVNEIIQDETFKLLTNPTYFNEHLKWKERRDILVDIAGGITDSDIVEANADLEQVMEKIEGKDAEEIRQSIEKQKKAIDKELDKIPVRIDELHLSMMDISNQSKSDLEADRQVLNETIGNIREEAESIRSGAEISKKRKRLSDIELEIANAKNEQKSKGMDQVYKIRASIQEKESNISILNSRIDNEHQKLMHLEQQYKARMERVQELRLEWVKEDEQEFQHDDHCICPTCEQDLPAEKVEEAKQRFNIQKAKKLEQIVASGKQAKEEADAFQADMEKVKETIQKLNKEIEKEAWKVDKLKADKKELESNVSIGESNPVLQQLEQEKEALQNDILKAMDSQNELIAEKMEQIKNLEEKKQQVDEELSQLLIVEKTKKRISELEEEETRLAKEYEALEHELYLIETYIRTKITLLENKINEKFEFTRFKLFEEQLNGGIKETCEATYQGVPYSRGLNNASRINVGLDVINTLNKHYGISVPIFIDNSESIVELLETESQMIKLTVSEKAEQLQINTTTEINQTA